ncbi:MAG: DUF1028 domain-containing protein [Candidatus Thorarchaeota archaeon]|nr:DUF1028 domain-containing protein [Candidatus Thorarchaeota archaeon]
MKKQSISKPSTFSIAARDPENGDLGVIVQSKFPAVGAMVPWAWAEVGAVATQAYANVSYGERGLYHMLEGKSASETLKELVDSDEKAAYRQVGIVDAKGRVATHTGKECMDWAGHVTGDGYSCQGNILAGEAVVNDMAEAFEKTNGDLIDKLFAGLKAGQAAGGDKRGMQSAAILIVRKGAGYDGGNDRMVDVRVDEHPSPIEELERVFAVYDMTLLSRENPSLLFPIDGPVAKRVQGVLVDLGYLKEVSFDEYWTSDAEKALQRWMSVENYENKYVEGKVWKSVMDALFAQWENR